MAQEIKLYYQNTRGLRTKREALFANAYECEYDIMCLTETWLNSSCSSACYFSDEYTVFRADRVYSDKIKYGGGVLIACRSVLNAFRRPDLETYEECVWLEIPTCDKSHYLVGCYYFPPNSAPNVFTDHFLDIGEKIDFLKYKVHIYGDFNLPKVDWSTGLVTSDCTATREKAECLIDFSNFHGLYQFNTMKNCAGNILDLILSNVPLFGVQAVRDPLVLVDKYHCPFTLSFFLSFRAVREMVPEKFRYAYGNYLRLYNDLLAYDWSELLETEDVNTGVELLTSTVQGIMKKCIPHRKSKKCRFPCWFSHDLRHYLKKKQKYHKLYVKSESEYWYQRYSLCRKIVKKLIARDEADYHRLLEQNFKKEPSSFWDFVRKQRNDKVSAAVIKTRDGICFKHQDVCQAFADHFSSCFVRHDNTTAVITLEDSADCLAYDIVTEHEVLSAIQKLKPKLSTGIDEIPSFIIKGCADIFGPVLAHLFNLSLRTGVFPRHWKLSVVVPVFKSGDACDVNNFRPVSLICSFAKVFEMIMCERMGSYFKQKISILQHGFLKGRSVETNLCSFLDYTGPHVFNRGQVDAVYFDMTKAFDMVSHEVLLMKMERYGLCPIYCRWLKSYLGSRRNMVRFSGCVSNEFLSSSGVPQGSNLGPLLFLVFINDLPLHVKNSRILLFADDFKLFRNIGDIEDCRQLQADINNVENWCLMNRLKLNIKKTSVLSLTRKRDTVTFDYTLLAGEISRVAHVRDLGVVVDSKLDFRLHVNSIVLRALRHIGLISRLTKKFRRHECLRTLYCALVRPRLEFASVAWNSVSVAYCTKIENVQRKFIRIYYDRYIGRRRFYDYDSLLADLNMSTLGDRRRIRDMQFLQNVVRGYINCGTLLMSLNFRVPHAKAAKCFDTFYPDLHAICPMTRLQILYNKTFNDMDIFA